MRTRHITSLSIALLIALAGPLAPSKAAESTLTNGCTHSTRGIPTCGAYFGAAYGSNTDPSSWESSMGKTIGVRRTYWGSGSAASAAKTAKADAAKNRVPWMSFNAPYSWSQMAAGKGDAWARDLATRMKSAGGPVWVAVDHEPEGEGDMQQWKAMQARIAPIMRAAAPNLGYSIILMGYHQLYGAAKYSLNATWPNTKIDVVGFDVYEKYGVKKSGQPTMTTWKDFRGDYFSKFQTWAKSKGVAWGLAETGYSDPAAKQRSGWISKTYNDMVAYGGIAFSYFNTNLHSQANWKLSLPTKQNAFTFVNKSAPTMR
jgi:hypothetical protein